MHNMVYIHEKWFYLKQAFQTVYLIRDEDKPERVSRSKQLN